MATQANASVDWCVQRDLAGQIDRRIGDEVCSMELLSVCWPDKCRNQSAQAVTERLDDMPLSSTFTCALRVLLKPRKSMAVVYPEWDLGGRPGFARMADRR